MYRDYEPKGVKFYYIYKYLAHAGAKGYVQPFTLQERLLHVQEAKRTLGTSIPWICDTMTNDLKHALGEAPTSEFVIDPEGVIVRARAWNDPQALRKDLADLVSPIENPTDPSELNLKGAPPPQVAARGVVRPVRRPPGRLKPLRIQPRIEAGGEPFYVKLRPQGDRSLLLTGKGKLLLDFRPDPIYHVHWNNLVKPIEVQLEPPARTTLRPDKIAGPKVQQPSDVDPRQFLIDVESENRREPILLTARYFACNDEKGWCKAITQRYEIYLEEDIEDGYYVTLTPDQAANFNAAGIQPYQKNPRYWQYHGKPVLLIGGSKDDSLFQIPDLEQHLDEIKAVGGNYIRNTMSDRPDFGFEVYPFRQLNDGQYDLNQWNNEYWNRLERMLQWTRERDIIVQIEIWDRFDYSDHRQSNRWLRHPYNPQNNINYTAEQSGLAVSYPKDHPNRNTQPFFFTVPAMQNNLVVLPYQMRRIDKILSYSLQYENVLYCIDNETSADPAWAKFWADRIQEKAAGQGIEVQVTEMWDQWDPRGDHHKQTYDYPQLYSFIDVSQNNHNKGQQHWDHLQWVGDYISQLPRPINTVKIYGADTGRFGNSRDAEERFWRNIFGGCAATRFHRPDSGLGLSERAKSHIKSMSMLVSELDIFRCTADANSDLLSGRSDNEAYLTCVRGQQYAVYFPDGGDVGLDLSETSGSFAVKWLDIAQSRWQISKSIPGGKKIDLRAPGSGHWAILLSKVK